VCREGVLRLRSFAFSRLQDEVGVHAEGKGPVVLVLDGVDAAGPFRARFLLRHAGSSERFATALVLSDQQALKSIQFSSQRPSSSAGCVRFDPCPAPAATGRAGPAASRRCEPELACVREDDRAVAVEMLGESNAVAVREQLIPAMNHYDRDAL